MLLLSFVLLAVAYQETEAEIEQRYVEEAKAAQKAFIEKGAITSGISLQYRDAFHRRDDPAMRPSLGSLRFFPEATLQGSDLKLLDRFQYVNSLEFYRRRFADNDF